MGHDTPSLEGENPKGQQVTRNGVQQAAHKIQALPGADCGRSRRRCFLLYSIFCLLGDLTLISLWLETVRLHWSLSDAIGGFKVFILFPSSQGSFKSHSGMCPYFCVGRVDGGQSFCEIPLERLSPVVIARTL